MFLGTVSASLFENLLAGKYVIRSGKETIRVFNAALSFN